MKPWADLRLPPWAVVKGHIPVDQSPPYLVADMVEIDLPDGTTIDVGWIPEHDPGGAYRVVVFKDYWHEQVEAPLLIKSLPEVITAVQQIAHARRDAPPAQNVACSGGIQVSWPLVPETPRRPVRVAAGA